MITNNLPTLPFADMLDLLPDGVICHEAVRDATETIVDFRLIYHNKAFELFAPAPYKRDLGLYMLADNPGQEAILGPAVQQYIRVIETGETADHVFYDPNLQATISLRAKKLGDGVLVTLRDITAQQEEAQRLEAQTKLLDGVLNASLNGIVTYSSVRNEAGEIVDFRAEMINDSAIAALQLPDKTPGWLLIDRFPEVIENTLFDVFVKVVITAEPVRFETPYRTNGVNGWHDMAVVKLGDGFVITFNDITASRQAAQQIEEQRNLLTGILNTSLNGTIVYEAVRDSRDAIADFRFRLHNQTARDDIWAGLGKDITGSTLLTVYPKSRETGMFNLYAQVTETGQSVHTEHFFSTLDIWYDVLLTKLNDGCVVTFINISESKRLAMRAEEQAKFVNSILDGSVNSIMAYESIRDHDGQIADFRVVLANHAAEAYLQHNADELTGQSLLTLFPEEYDMGLFARYIETVETGRSFRTEAQYQNDDDDSWIDLSATKLGDGFVVTFTDISNLKKAVRHADLLVQELQKTNANLEEFAYVASHDLQEPLRKIAAFSDMLLNQYADNLGPTGIDMIGRMQSAAVRMQTLIRDLLTYSKVANTKEFFRPVDLNLVVAEVLNDLELVIETKKAEVTVGALPILHGDALQLRQLFQNILSNGLKFNRMDVVPQLKISADLVRGREIVHADGSNLLPAALGNKGFHRIQVADNGIGFEPQYAQQIFQVFQRLHTRAHYSGTGIGLSIVQKVVDNHRGFITAEGRPNQGATFIILFPIQLL